MQSSSSENFKRNDSGPQQHQTSEEGEGNSEESNHIQGKVSVKSNTLDETEISGKSAVSDSEPLSSSNFDQINVITSEKDIIRMTIINKNVEEEEKNESNAATCSEPVTSTEEINFKISGKHIKSLRKTSLQKLLEVSRKLNTIFSFGLQNKQRQPYGRQQQGSRSLPTPPHYYASSGRQRENSPHDSRNTQSQREGQRYEIRTQYGEHRYDTPLHMPIMQLAMYPQLFTQAARWAPYPNRLPDDCPSSLAQLLDIEALFVIKRFDIIEFIADIVEPNFYLVINDRGECLYCIYETSDFCAQSCLGNIRGLQLHIKDLYDNEVIFMNRYCGCTYFFCCYPAIEIYSPTTGPLGAVTKVCSGYRASIIIMDPDENILFKINGDDNCLLCCSGGFFTVELPIHALDSQETTVGFIRREILQNPIQFIADFSYYGLSFPGNMDVRIKALFLGALLLCDYMYFDRSEGCCSCCCCCS